MGKHDLPQIIDRILKLKADGCYRFTCETDRLFSELSSFRIGGAISFVLSPSDIPSLCLLTRELYDGGVPYLVLGAGSNILPPDEGYHGVVLLTSRLRKMQLSGNRLTVLCGTPLNESILFAARNGLCGMEHLYGIPATVGGAIFMNAGAHGTSIADTLECVSLYDPATDTVLSPSCEEMRFSYRHSMLQDHKRLVVLSATFCLSAGCREDILQTVQKTMRLRASSQPLEYPSAGSTFRRPRPDTEVWRLIDACGLRGYRIGDAQISEKHAGFIVNRGKARAADVRELIVTARREVLHTFGILLIPEVEILGK